FTCTTEELRSFTTSAAPLVPFTSSPSKTENDLRDAIINNYISLIDNGIPCLWRYAEGTNLEHIYNSGEITRELWIFWLGCEVPSILESLYKKDGKQFVLIDSLSLYSQLFASLLQFRLFGDNVLFSYNQSMRSFS